MSDVYELSERIRDWAKENDNRRCFIVYSDGTKVDTVVHGYRDELSNMISSACMNSLLALSLIREGIVKYMVLRDAKELEKSKLN